MTSQDDDPSTLPVLSRADSTTSTVQRHGGLWGAVKSWGRNWQESISGFILWPFIKELIIHITWIAVVVLLVLIGRALGL